MKTTKKIFAAVLAVMMIALMIPFSASAATSDTYNAFIKGKNGFTVNVYKVAKINTTTGEYTEIQGGTAVATALKTWKNASGNDSKALLAACESATFTDADSKGDHTFASDEDVYNFGTNEAGVYYVKVTGQPAETSVKKKGGALFALPEGTKTTQGSAEAPIELKINTGAVEVSKEIVGGDIDTKSTTASAGDTVTFKLTASVTGSKEVPLTEYTIHDNLSGSFDTPAVTEVKVDNTKLSTSDYTVDASSQSDIKISLSESYLKAAKEGTNNFYASSDVTVTLTAILKDTAVSGNTATANSNSDSLTYTNVYGQTEKSGETVYVYTFDLPVFKYDGTTDNKTGLGNATFELKTKEGTLIDTKTTDSSGNVTFAKLAAGTYKVKETVAPAGYNLNSS